MKLKLYKAASMFQGDNWCAKCVECGEVLTKYCWDEGEARRQALAAGHKCGEALK